ncbi:MAG: DUF4339 domain-containing protein [Verrucomicrobia bacterium]|nr:MAG: DUF4339 domain-containing protein [Verrucomicrobiota bacterium]
MYWMIGGDGREYGPVEADQLRTWIAEHRANAQTLVRREGESDWVALGTLPEFAEALRQAYPTVPPVPPVSPTPTMAVPPTRTFEPAGGTLDVGASLTRAVQLLGRNFPLFALGSLILWLLSFLGQTVVCAGPIAALLLTGPLTSGLCLVMLKRARNEPAAPRDQFTFMGPLFVPFMLLGVVHQVAVGLGMVLCVVPGLVLAWLWSFAFVIAADRQCGFWDALRASAGLVRARPLATLVLVTVAWLPSILASAYVLWQMSAYSNELFFATGVFDFDAERFEMFARRAAGLEMQRLLVLLFNLPFGHAVIVQAYADLTSSAAPETA